MEGNNETPNQSFGISVFTGRHALADLGAVSNPLLNKSGEIDKTFTRAQLWNYSSHVGKILVQDCGVKPGDRVMIVYPFGIDWIVDFLACSRVGVTIVSVYPPNPNRLSVDIPKFKRFVQDSQSKVALTTRTCHAVVRGSSMLRKWPAGLKWIVTDNYKAEEGTAAPQLTQYDVDAQSDSPVLIQYTSGSTADPKGVVLSHNSLSHQMQSQQGPVEVDARGSYVGWAAQVRHLSSHDSLLLLHAFSMLTITLTCCCDMGLFAVLSPRYNGKDTSYTMSPLDWLQNPVLWPRVLEKYPVGPNFAYALTCRRLQEKGLSFDGGGGGRGADGAADAGGHSCSDADPALLAPQLTSCSRWTCRRPDTTT